MNIETTSIPDIRIITPRRFGDARGFFAETWSRPRMAEAGIDVDFVRDNHSKRVNVDFPTWVVAGLDRQAQKFGITRQALSKMWIAERLE